MNDKVRRYRKIDRIMKKLRWIVEIKIIKDLVKYKHHRIKCTFNDSK